MSFLIPHVSEGDRQPNGGELAGNGVSPGARFHSPVMGRRREPMKDFPLLHVQGSERQRQSFLETPFCFVFTKQPVIEVTQPDPALESSGTGDLYRFRFMLESRFVTSW